MSGKCPPKQRRQEQAKPLGPGAKRHKNTEPSGNRMDPEAQEPKGPAGHSPALQPKFTPRTHKHVAAQEPGK